MKVFVILVLLFLVLFFIASTSLANVDLTPDTPAANTSFSAPAEEPQVINIQNPTPVVPVVQSNNDTGGTVPVTGACTDPYTIQPGDMLSSIAELCNTTVAAIRLANPGITNVNMIFPGQQIRIPGAPAGQQAAVAQPAAPAQQAAPSSNAPEVVAQSPTVPVTTPAAASTAPVPVTGPFPVIESGTMLVVQARYYPPNTPVNIAIGPQSVGYNIIATGITDATGSLIARVVAPTAPNAQTPWVVVVATTGKPPIQAMSNPFYLK